MATALTCMLSSSVLRTSFCTMLHRSFRLAFFQLALVVQPRLNLLWAMAPTILSCCRRSSASLSALLADHLRPVLTLMSAWQTLSSLLSRSIMACHAFVTLYSSTCYWHLQLTACAVQSNWAEALWNAKPPPQVGVTQEFEQVFEWESTFSFIRRLLSLRWCSARRMILIRSLRLPQISVSAGFSLSSATRKAFFSLRICRSPLRTAISFNRRFSFGWGTVQFSAPFSQSDQPPCSRWLKTCPWACSPCLLRLLPPALGPHYSQTFPIPSLLQQFARSLAFPEHHLCLCLL